MTETFKPINGMISIEAPPNMEVRQSGLHIPSNYKAHQIVRGKVLAVSDAPDAKCPFNVGDTVCYAYATALAMVVNQKTIFVTTFAEVLGVIENPEPVVDAEANGRAKILAEV